MSSFSKYKYFLKNKDGNLVPKTNGELIELIKNKELKADTKIYTTQYNKWMKLKDLQIYKNKAQYSKSDAINNSEYIEVGISKKSPIAPITHEQYITLIDEVEDARAVSFQSQFEHSELIRSLKNEKESLLNKCQRLEFQSEEAKQEAIRTKEEFQAIKKEFTKLNSTLEYGKDEVEFTKIKAELINVNKELDLTKIENNNLKDLNNQLILQIESMKQDISSYILQKEEFETDHIKIKNEKKFYAERLSSYKNEIQRLAHELSKKKDLYHSILEKYEISQTETNDIRLQNSSYRTELDEARKELSFLKESHNELQDNYKDVVFELSALKKHSYTTDIDVQKSKDQNEYLNKRLKQVLKEREELSLQVDNLSQIPPVPERYIPEPEHENKIQEIQEKNDVLKTRVEYLKEKLAEQEKTEVHSLEMQRNLNQKDKEIEYIKSRAYKMLIKKKKLEELVKKQMLKIKQLDDFKKAASKKFGDSVHDLNNQIEAYKREIEEERNKSSQIIESLSDVQKDEVLVDDLLNTQKNIADEEIVADQESIGELFEINNEPMWKLKFENKVGGPYSFLDIKDMLEQREINSTHSIKKPGTPWKKIEDIFEFNTEILTKKESGETKLYIKRDDLRIPVFEDVTMILEDNEYQGKCSNLSSGGCFVESTAFNNKNFVVGKEIKIIFTGDGNHKNLELITQLRSITKDMPPGAGFKFTNMDEEKLSKLSKFFEKFSKTFGKKAA